MAELIEIDLGKEGIEYVEDCLRQGTGLSRKILSLPLQSGRAFAPLPTNTSVDRARSFEAGGLLSWRDTLDWLARHVQAEWRRDPEGTLVLQDVWGARPTDEAVQRTKVRKFFDAENVYYYVEASEQQIEDIVRETSSFLVVGVFAHFPVGRANLRPPGIVAKSFIDRLARTTEEILVTAYDREGLVLWRR